MEERRPLLTAEEIAGLLGKRPPTVEEVLRMELMSTVATDRARSPGVLRRAIAGALHVAADAIYSPSTR